MWCRWTLGYEDFPIEVIFVPFPIRKERPNDGELLRSNNRWLNRSWPRRKHLKRRSKYRKSQFSRRNLIAYWEDDTSFKLREERNWEKNTLKWHMKRVNRLTIKGNPKLRRVKSLRGVPIDQWRQSSRSKPSKTRSRFSPSWIATSQTKESKTAPNNRNSKWSLRESRARAIRSKTNRLPLGSKPSASTETRRLISLQSITSKTISSSWREDGNGAKWI